MNEKLYIASIELENYTSFAGKHRFEFTDKEQQLFQWSVILGNNNTGKTNLLKALAGMNINDQNNEITDYFRGTKKNLTTEVMPSSSINITIHKPELENKNPFKQISVELKELQDFILLTNEEIKTKGVYYNYTNKSSNAFYHWESKKSSIAYSYGVSRRFGESSLSEKANQSNVETLFDASKTLVNIEEWLLQLDYASKNNDTVAQQQLIKLKELIKSDIFPEINDVRFVSEMAKSYVEFQTLEGWQRLKQLGYGYQTTLSWIFDLSKKMFERYPDSPNPLKEAAVVLIDELDLHLHPQWQREIIKYLSDIFTQTQFIVTTHSPFIIQSIEKINLYLLVKTSEGIQVSRPPYQTFKGWSIEEILEEVLGLGEKTKSDNYLGLIKEFDQALDTQNKAQAEKAYSQLTKILHPQNEERKLLKLQLSQLIDND